MRALVAAASKHGATEEIASVIAEMLERAGVEPVRADPALIDELPEVDAAIIGSAVYAGHWMEPARKLVERNAETLSRMPVWLFSSGPIGDPLRPEEDPVDVARLVELTAAEEHRVFAGRLRRAGLGFGERAIVAALRAPAGDFRDWEAIEGWASEIGRVLREPSWQG